MYKKYYKQCQRMIFSILTLLIFIKPSFASALSSYNSNVNGTTGLIRTPIAFIDNLAFGIDARFGVSSKDYIRLSERVDVFRFFEFFMSQKVNDNFSRSTSQVYGVKFAAAFPYVGVALLGSFEAGQKHQPNVGEITGIISTRFSDFLITLSFGKFIGHEQEISQWNFGMGVSYNFINTRNFTLAYLLELTNYYGDTYEDVIYNRTIQIHTGLRAGFISNLVNVEVGGEKLFSKKPMFYTKFGITL
jgi:hypothetical protein